MLCASGLLSVAWSTVVGDSRGVDLVRWGGHGTGGCGESGSLGEQVSRGARLWAQSLEARGGFSRLLQLVQVEGKLQAQGRDGRETLGICN